MVEKAGASICKLYKVIRRISSVSILFYVVSSAFVLSMMGNNLTTQIIFMMIGAMAILSGVIDLQLAKFYKGLQTDGITEMDILSVDFMMAFDIVLLTTSFTMGYLNVISLMR